MIWELPVVALRNMVILPGITMNIDVGRPKSKRAVDEAQSSDRRVLLLTQRDARTDDPTRAELYEMGVLAVVKQVVRMPDNTYQVLVEAQERAKVMDEVPSAYLRVRAETQVAFYVPATGTVLRISPEQQELLAPYTGGPVFR